MNWRDVVRWCAAGLAMWFLCFLCYVVAYQAILAVFG